MTTCLIPFQITDIERKTVGGFARGKLILEGLGSFTKQNLEVEFQNENLIAQKTVGGKKEVCSLFTRHCLVSKK